MLKRILGIILALFLLSYWGFSEETYYRKDNLLNIGIGARPMALGKSFIGIDNDVNAILFNPAGTATIKDFQVMGLKSQRLIDINQYTVLGAYALPEEKGVLSIGYIELSLTDILLSSPDLDSEGYVQVAGKADYSEKVYILNYAKKIAENQAIGINYKIYRNNLNNDTKDLFEDYYAEGNDIDIGYQLFLNEKISLGLAYHNLSGSMRWNNETNEKILGSFKAGIVYRTAFFGKPSLLCLDGESFADGPGLGHFGLETELQKGFSFRYGLNQRIWKDTTKFSSSLGAGLNFWGFAFDYSYCPEFGESIDPKHFFSISYQFYQEEPKVYAAKKKTPQPPKQEKERSEENYKGEYEDIKFIYQENNR